MKKVFIFSGLLLLILNSLLGLILSRYEPFNWIINDFIILINVAFLGYLATSRIKDAFKFGLTLLLFVAGLAEFLLGLFMESYLTDNFLFILICTALIIQLGSLVLVRWVDNFA